MRLKSHWIFFYTFDRSESIFLGVGGEEYIPKCACRCAVRCEGIITHTHTHTQAYTHTSPANAVVVFS